jgi:DNA processing protein
VTELNDDERIDWLRLIRSDNIGPRTFKSLLNNFGSASAALDALPMLARRGGATRPARIGSRADAEREMETATRLGAMFIATCEPAYPPRLAAIDDAPPLLAVRGNLDALTRPIIAIVGSRNASAAALKFAERLARELREAGFAIASGLARGIDAAAHRASLATGTIAVLAGGQDRIYPEQHIDLLEALLSEGAAISEMPFGWEPRAQDFPRRNRLISGLSLGVVIVEAAKRSGSLITARFALEQGREVFAVPGSPLDPRSRGCNDLLRNGATLTETAADILTQLGPLLQSEMPSSRAMARQMQRRLPMIDAPPSLPATPEIAEDSALELLVEKLSPTPVAVDELVRQCHLSAASIATLLLELELAGRIERHPGNLVSLR